jgi:septal ring factor EnvC (AmiA/AmiB activator)
MPGIRHSGQCRPASQSGWRLRRGLLHFCAVLGVALLACAGSPDARAAKATDRSKQKQVAEAERAALRQKLTALKRDISKTETAKGHAADALAHSEAAISDANRSLHELAEEQKETAARLSALSKQQSDLQRTVAAQQTRLARLVREQHMGGSEDRIKLLLSGDNPNRISRDMQLMGYVSQAQARLLESLRANLAAVEKNKEETQNAQNELEEIAAEERQQKALLEKEKAKRAVLLSQLSGKLAAQRKEAGNIERDDKRLAGLVDKLARLIEEQRKAEAAEAARRRQQAALKKAERQKQRAQGKTPSRTAVAPGRTNPNAIEPDENPSELPDRNELVPDPGVQNGSAFSALRGQLRLPVRGELTAKFGSKRGDGPAWKGLFIRAPEGAEVKAVAGGRVVFAEWLRGFGNLVIVDHGGQYMTIYGNNQAVLKRPGDAVKTGDVIASTGNSGGNEQSGLYFEIRHQGRAFDPLTWISTR